MSLVATLIAGGVNPRLDESAVAEAARRVSAAVEWLDPGRAADLAIEQGERENLDAAIRDSLDGSPVDIVIHDPAHRRKKLLVADMDSTVITVECIDVLAAHAGIGDKIAEITARTIRGELDFAQSLRERVALLAGTPVSALEMAWRNDVRLTPGARTLIATMRAHGALTALISGGFTWFTERVADAAGFDTHQANRLLIENGRLTGELTEPILDRGAKEVLLRQLAEQHNIDMAETLAVGDGANDIAMIKVAGLGVSYHGVEAVRSVADADIRHGNLTALLYIQGYRRSELVEA